VGQGLAGVKLSRSLGRLTILINHLSANMPCLPQKDRSGHWSANGM
jgi:hypothetical protein